MILKYSGVLTHAGRKQGANWSPKGTYGDFLGGHGAYRVKVRSRSTRKTRSPSS
ncbi:hypothetical protein YC2023_065239 [Brassica napus]